MTCFRPALALSLLLFTTGCRDITCPPWPTPAVQLELRSAIDGSPIIGALGDVRDGQYRDSLVDLKDGWYMAADDRPGTYAVHVESQGFSPLDTTVHAVEVGGSCPTITSRIIEARPEPAE